ncbi:MAG: 2-oxo acid dehydrogenase subunit E2 [Verrucomicrobia bacterium]|nr:2-oxo acid dehydrogenase subunit E2 [Verrucomicrobiota bacterium]
MKQIKALFPIESHVAGVLREWLIAEEDEVEVDQLIALLEVEVAVVAETGTKTTAPAQVRPAKEASVGAAPAPRVSTRPTDGGLSPHIIAQMRNAVPAHMTVKADWAPIREARADAKARLGSKAPSPTVMVAWSVVQAMKKHPVFNCTIAPTDTLIQHDDFDFGVAVSLANDALDTAVIECANQLSWQAFAEAYDDAVRKVRSGIPTSKACTPLILTSMGGFNVRDAAPVVVPPAIGTLFIGEAHWDLDADGTPVEKVNLCLTFDHRWLNGVAGAQFLSDVRTEIEKVSLR